ncbi:MAG: hypothetical protein PUB75_02180 [Firmicutes bacterium]|nr:hypothetical protein [Bacillota bacterium]
METLLYGLAMVIARVHSFILSLNNQFEYYFSDKELHFIVMGLLGLAMVFVLHPVFKWLASRGNVMVITFFYVFTFIIVIAFAIEIGQRMTGTGSMESADIAWGIMGFLCIFAVFAVIRAIFTAIRNAVRRRRR